MPLGPSENPAILHVIGRKPSEFARSALCELRGSELDGQGARDPRTKGLCPVYQADEWNRFEAIVAQRVAR